MVDLMGIINEGQGAKEWALYMGLVYDLMGQAQITVNGKFCQPSTVLKITDQTRANNIQ